MNFFKNIFNSEPKAPSKESLFAKYGVNSQRELDEVLEAEYQASLKGEVTPAGQALEDAVIAAPGEAAQESEDPTIPMAA
jgi:hypothetical protein